MAVISPMDFERIFITIMAGSPEYFTGIFVLFVSGLGAYFNIPGNIMLVVYLLLAIIMSTYMPGLYILAILITGFIVFYLLARLINR